MNKVQKWEVAGVPAAILFSAAHNLGWLAKLGVKEDQLPDVMVLGFVFLALVRMALDYIASKKAQS